uniref:Large ribosomal subunit protein P1 n=1 Tax=Macrostomum lignano TaxID=282301 RepID=A0A1I8IGI2_9PLAT
MSAENLSEMACTYAALILADDDVEVTGDKISAILKAAGVTVEPFWPNMFARALSGVKVKDLLSNVGSSVGAAPAAGAAAPEAAAAAAEPAAAKGKAKEPEPESESDDDMGFDLDSPNGVSTMSAENLSEMACTYAALILADDDVEVTGDKISAILKAAGVTVEPFWPNMFARALSGVKVKDLLSNVGSSVGAAPAAGAAAPEAAAAAAEPAAAKGKAKEPEPESESDDDMGFDLSSPLLSAQRWSSLELFSVYETASHYYVIGSDQAQTYFRLFKLSRTDKAEELNLFEDSYEYSLSEIHRFLQCFCAVQNAQSVATDQARQQQQQQKKASPLPEKCINACGILGFVRFTEGYYLALVTRASVAAQLCEHTVHRIEEARLVCLHPSGRPQSSEEQRYVRQFGQLRLLHGYIGQSSIDVCGRTVFATLIGRRSRRYAGTRYLKRGCDYQGNAANEVETEQVLHDPTSCSFALSRVTAFVQVRGSVPAIWSQDIQGVVTKPPPVTVHFTDSTCAFSGQHFCSLLARRVAIVFVSRLQQGAIHRVSLRCCWVGKSHFGPYWIRLTLLPVSIRSVGDFLTLPGLCPLVLHSANLRPIKKNGVLRASLIAVVYELRRPRSDALLSGAEVAVLPSSRCAHEKHYPGPFALDERCIEYVDVRNSQSSKIAQNAPKDDEPSPQELFSAGTQECRYGSPIQVVNLMKQQRRSQREVLLTQLLTQSVRYLNQFVPASRCLLFRHFDMARIQKQPGRSVLLEFAPIAADLLAANGLFCRQAGRTESVQLGVARTNCVDCLDRTNTAQYVLGLLAAGRQLDLLGLVDYKPDETPFNTQLDAVITNLYEDHGDALALQYGGSQLVHNVDTYRKLARTVWGSQRRRDLGQTLQRYINNTFTDTEKQ